MDNYKDLIFLAVDHEQLEMAEYLAHLGSDLRRKEPVSKSCHFTQEIV